MQICRTIPEMRAVRASLGADIGYVATMGGLHAGHMALVAAARARSAPTVASIFVNPTQFENPADLSDYPADTDRDLAMLEAGGVAAVFLPGVQDIYPEGAETIVEPTRLANMLHGEVRLGHFRGVATVVAKLFHIIAPQRAYFGKKDYQQLAVIRQMVRDLHMPVEIAAVETVREEDGLALSSRNGRLSEAERAAAPVLYRALQEAASALQVGRRAPHGPITIENAKDVARARLAGETLARLERIDIVDPESFAPLRGAVTGQVGMMISAHVGETLLLDQLEATI
ncbi:MAG: pantoate--beta-alanine ligase [Pseudomonadota bacterium]